MSAQLFSSEPSEKICVDCRATLPVTEFNPNQHRRDGRSPYCRRCGTARVRISRGVLPEVARLQPMPDDRCAICRSDGGQRGLFLDHDHGSGEFRGWLCHSCNTGIGYFADDPGRLHAAVTYLAGATEAAE